MKKLFVLVFAIALCLGALCFGASADYDENGFGVGDDAGLYQPATLDEHGVYQIGNVGQLYWFADYVNKGNSDVNAELTTNITINEDVLNEDGTLNGDGTNFRSWTSIDAFSGNFDGNGHTISGLYLYDSVSFLDSDYYGMFESVRDGTVNNLTLVDSYVAVELATSGSHLNVGGIFGLVNSASTVSGCSFNGTVSAVSTSKTNTMYVGGVCGRNEGKLQDLGFSGSLTVKNTDDNLSGQRDVTTYGGGICGYNIGTVERCINRGTITGGGYNPTVGGICGFGGETQTPGLYKAAKTMDRLLPSPKEQTETPVVPAVS